MYYIIYVYIICKQLLCNLIRNCKGPIFFHLETSSITILLSIVKPPPGTFGKSQKNLCEQFNYPMEMFLILPCGLTLKTLKACPDTLPFFWKPTDNQTFLGGGQYMRPLLLTIAFTPEWFPNTPLNNYLPAELFLSDPGIPGVRSMGRECL